MSLQTFRDLATVSEDVIDVVAAFPDIAPALIKIGKDAVQAVLSRSAPAFAQVITDATAAYAAFQADKGAAAPAMEKLIADLNQLASDL
jgi:hypothetical protein